MTTASVGAAIKKPVTAPLMLVPVTVRLSVVVVGLAVRQVFHEVRLSANGATPGSDRVVSLRPAESTGRASAMAVARMVMPVFGVIPPWIAVPRPNRYGTGGPDDETPLTRSSP